MVPKWPRKAVSVKVMMVCARLPNMIGVAMRQISRFETEVFNIQFTFEEMLELADACLQSASDWFGLARATSYVTQQPVLYLGQN